MIMSQQQKILNVPEQFKLAGEEAEARDINQKYQFSERKYRTSVMFFLCKNRLWLLDSEKGYIQ
jgi:hypothetical protein